MPGRDRRSLTSRLRSDVRAFLLSEGPPESYWRWPGVGRSSAKNIHVNDQTAFQVSTVLSCVKVLAESIATPPLLPRSARS